MKNYLDILTDEEKKKICNIIPIKQFRKAFIQNDKEFHKLKKGFRAETMSDADIRLFVLDNLDKKFIIYIINKYVEFYIKRAKKEIKRLEDEEISHEYSVAMTLCNFDLCENIELHLKLIGETNDSDEYTIIKQLIKLIQVNKIMDTDNSKRIKEIEREKEQIQREIDDIRRNSEKKIDELNEENQLLLNKNTEIQKEIDQIKYAKVEHDNRENILKEQANDTDLSRLPIHDENETVSLCCVVEDYNGKRLFRYADLDENGTFHVFERDKQKPPTFKNRDRLFSSDETYPLGKYGIWKWRATPRDTDSSRDFVTSKYISNIDLIEIINISEASNMEDLVDLIKKGITYQHHSRKILFSYKKDSDTYAGILCNSKQIDFDDNKNEISFSKNCNEISVYEFDANDIIECKDAFFLKRIFAGKPTSLYPIRKPAEIVKNIVYSSISKQAFRARGFNIAEIRKMKEFIEAIPIGDVKLKIKDECHCSNDEADQLLQNFMNDISKYIDGGTIEDEMIYSAFSGNYQLQEKAKKLIQQDWEAENKSKIDDANKNLESINNKFEIIANKLSKAQKTLEEVKEEHRCISEKIVAKRELAEEVEKEVADRIQAASNHAAEFISHSAFIKGICNQGNACYSNIQTDTLEHTYKIVSSNDDNTEMISSWDNILIAVSDELYEAGISDKYVNGVAAFLCAAYIEKQPIFLVGPNAYEIIKAFCSVVSGCRYGIINSSSNFNRQIISEIGSCGEDIVVVPNILENNWLHRVPELLERKDVFFIATHPFAEDIQVEPNSLYNFMLPLFTDFIVDKSSSGKYGISKIDNNIKLQASLKNEPNYSNIFTAMKLNNLIKNRCVRLSSAMHAIYSDITDDDIFITLILPLAYGLMRINQLVDMLKESNLQDKFSSTLRRDLQYILGDFNE